MFQKIKVLATKKDKVWFEILIHCVVFLLLLQILCSSLLDAIKAVDEACDESQRRRVRQETARIVSNTFSYLSTFAADFPQFSQESLTLLKNKRYHKLRYQGIYVFPWGIDLLSAWNMLHVFWSTVYNLNAVRVFLSGGSVAHLCRWRCRQNQALPSRGELISLSCCYHQDLLIFNYS